MTNSLVVGGTRGIGREVTHVMRRMGSQVTAVGRELPVAPLEGVEYFSADVADDASRTSILEVVNRLGDLDHLIFVQRYRGGGDAWAGELNVSLLATARLIDELSERLVADASIVVVGSVNSRFVTPRLPASYHVVKAGLSQMVRYYAAVLGPRQVRVNCVSPGSTIKDENEKYYAGNRDVVESLRELIPLRRMGRAEDVAAVVGFLCSSQAAYLTGQEIVVDGGASLLLQEAIVAPR